MTCGGSSNCVLPDERLQLKAAMCGRAALVGGDTSSQDMVAYLDAAFEENDPAVVAAALGNIARGKDRSQRHNA